MGCGPSCPPAAVSGAEQAACHTPFYSCTYPCFADRDSMNAIAACCIVRSRPVCGRLLDRNSSFGSDCEGFALAGSSLGS